MGMVDNVLVELQKSLNQAFQRSQPRAEDWVILSNLVDHEGKMVEDTRDKVVLSLVNIQHETIVSTYNRTIPAADGAYTVVSPPIYINLYVMFMANFLDRNYTAGLDAISQTISYFQQNPYLTHATNPNLSTDVDKIVMELANLDMMQVNYVMGMLGSKYLPAVFYKLRMLPFNSQALMGVAGAVSGPSVNP